MAWTFCTICHIYIVWLSVVDTETMSINILKGTKENLEVMKGQTFVPQPGEGVIYLKLVMIKPDTMKNGDPERMVDIAPGVILCGQLDEIRDQIQEWFNESASEYRAITEKTDSESESNPGE